MSNPNRLRITFGPIKVGVERMLRMQGYTDLRRVRRPIWQAANEMASLAVSLAEPAVQCLRIDIRRLCHGRLTLANGTELTSPAFDHFSAKANGVVLFVLTAGWSFDTELERLNDTGELLQQLFLEAAGWLTIEAITKQLVMQLRTAIATDGLRLSRRLGPGYTYPLPDDQQATWPLEDQGPLFAAFAGLELPVQLLDSFAMRPRMSRSGLFGLIPRNPAPPKPALDHK